MTGDRRIAASILKRAQSIKGGPMALASFLDVDPEDLARWCGGLSLPPEGVLDAALDLVVERKLSTAKAASEAGSYATDTD